MFLIGVAGGSGSGKTTFVNKILKHLDGEDVAVLHQDSYYLPSPPSHLRIHGENNFDHPDAFDWVLLKDNLSRLKAGERVLAPIYDFQTSRRESGTQRIGPCKAVLMEGIYTLWDPGFRGLFDIRVFLNVEADIRFIRRLHRDVRERSRTVDGIIRQYYDTVRPMHHEYIEPTRQFADIVVGEETDIAAETLAARIFQVLSKSLPNDTLKEP